MTTSKFCPICKAFLNKHRSLHKWRSCWSCGFARLEKEMLTLSSYLMGRSEDEKYKSEYSNEIRDNALILINKVNSLLTELGILEITVSSGWRPSIINSSLPNSAKKSLHQIGMAVDLVDLDHKIYKQIEASPELLIKHGLWMEDIESTPTWVHLDCSTKRKDRPVRIFKP